MESQGLVSLELISQSGTQGLDEIEYFQDALYASDCERDGSITGLKVNHRSPPVLRLYVHLKDHNTQGFRQ